MKIEYQEYLPVNQTIFYAVLNWGLGHATRSIPLIKSCLLRENRVIVGSDGDALSLLSKEFPDLEFVELPAYNVRYPTSSAFINMTLHGPGLLLTIEKEYKLTNEIVSKYGVDLIISDNRYGCYSKNIKSVIITHQVSIPHPNPVLAKVAGSANKQWLGNFNEVWVPDYADHRLSGDLSKGKVKGVKKFLGSLSRLEYSEKMERGTSVLFLLSGPEPQRSYFENQCLQIARNNPNVHFEMVRGTSITPPDSDLPSNCLIHGLLNSKELEAVLKRAKLVISRTGYTTILDLDYLNIPAILVPTPGQPEQEYLGKFHKSGIRFTVVNSGSEQDLEREIQAQIQTLD